MKKIIFLLVSLLLLVVLTACGSTTQEEVISTATDGEDSVVLNTNYESALPIESQLALGVFKLDEGENAVNAEQAAELLPLWRAANSLAASETTAAQEMEAVFNQIRDTLTPEQIEEIAAMELTRQDLVVIGQEMGLVFGAGGDRFGELTPEQQATMEAARESGDFPREGFGGQGGVPGGGFGRGGGEGGIPEGLSPEMRETAMAERGGGRGFNSGLNTFLIEAVITFLEGKTQ